MMLFGWSMDQIAIAANRFKRIQGYLPTASIEGLGIIKSWWQSQGYPDPGSIDIVGAVLDKDFKYVEDLIDNKVYGIALFNKMLGSR